MSAEPSELAVHRHLLVSERLRTRRRGLGLTQKQVVTRLWRIGVATTNKALSSLEHGAGLDVAKLPELARALDCTTTYLLGLTDDPRSWEPDPVDGQPRAGLTAGSTNGDRPEATPPSPRSADGRSWILGPEVPDLPIGRPATRG